jgi:uncharacterized protein
MNKLRVFFLVLGLWSSVGYSAPELPSAPQSYVVDEVGVIDPKVLRSLQMLFAAHEKATTDQIVIAVFQSLSGEDLVMWTNQIFQQWQIGKKGKDNGVLLALYWKDRKARIEVGYGLEPQLTDAKSKRILSEELVPELKSGHPNQGLTRASLAILSALNSPLIKDGQAHKILAQQGVHSPQSMQQQSMPFWLALLVFVLLFLIVILKGIFSGGIQDARSAWRRTPWFPNRRSGWDNAPSEWDRPKKGGWEDDTHFRGGGGSSGGGGANDSW